MSEFGRIQAELLADALAADARPTVVYSSPYPRAVQTAAQMCWRLDVQPIVDPGLAEFRFEGGTFKSIQQRPEHRGAVDGETLGRFSARVAGFCDEVVGRHQAACVAMFAHSGTIDAAVRWALGFPPDGLWQHELDLVTASVTEIEFWPHGRTHGGAPRYSVIRRIGDVAHLGDLVSDL